MDSSRHTVIGRGGSGMALAAALLAALSCGACSHRALVGVNAEPADGSGPGPLLDGSRAIPDSPGADIRGEGDPAWTCAPGARLIWVVDITHKLFRFDPTRNTVSSAFISQGTLQCPVQGVVHSMAVRRNGTAFVLFSESVTGVRWKCKGLCRVDLQTLKCELLKAYTCGTAGIEAFGMGYAATAGGITEELFIGSVQSSILARLDPEAGSITPIGYLPSPAPEFAGNASGELWGFFPSEIPASVHRIDPSSGKVLSSIKLSQFTQPWAGAYAFSMWGGVFYIFYGYSSGATTNVYRLTPDGKLSLHLKGTGLNISGAGVSTCAPAGGG